MTDLNALNRFRLTQLLPAFFLLFFISSCKSQTQSPAMNYSVVKELDLQRYLGVWYEIARFPHSFENGLQGVTATYSLRDDGLIRVENKGYKNTLDGKMSVSVGKAKLRSENEPARFKVSFFWFFYAPYDVMELDPDYQWALVGSASPNYLWILSRNPHMDEGLYQSIVQKAKDRGFDTSKLIRVQQR